MKIAGKGPTTLPTQKKAKYEQRKRRLPPQYAYSQVYGLNHQTYNEPPERTPQVAAGVAVETVAVEAVAVEAVTEAAVEEEIPPQQEDRPQATPEEGITDFSDNPRTYSPGTAPRRRSSSHNGSSTTT